LIFEKLRLDPILTLEFLGAFSRLEFALKVTSFRQPQNGEAKADWQKFSIELSAIFAPESSEEVKKAYDYLMTDPPHILTARDGRIFWAEAQARNTSKVDQIIWSIKQVRNNLFHGGKFAHDSSAEPTRDEMLLRASILLIKHFVSLAPEIEAAVNS
jgi:hypothetical protein